MRTSSRLFRGHSAITIGKPVLGIGLNACATLLGVVAKSLCLACFAPEAGTPPWPDRSIVWRRGEVSGTLIARPLADEFPDHSLAPGFLVAGDVCGDIPF